MATTKNTVTVDRAVLEAALATSAAAIQALLQQQTDFAALAQQVGRLADSITQTQATAARRLAMTVQQRTAAPNKE